MDTTVVVEEKEEKESFLLEDAVLKSKEEQGRNGLVCAKSSLRH